MKSVTINAGASILIEKKVKKTEKKIAVKLFPAKRLGPVVESVPVPEFIDRVTRLKKEGGGEEEGGPEKETPPPPPPRALRGLCAALLHTDVCHGSKKA